MKKLVTAAFIFALAMPHIQARGSGGAVVAGTLGGLAVGTMIGSSTARSSHSDDARVEQDRQRVSQLERELDKRAIEQRLSEKTSYTPMFLMFIVVILLMVMGFLVVLLLRRRH